MRPHASAHSVSPVTTRAAQDAGAAAAPAAASAAGAPGGASGAGNGQPAADGVGDARHEGAVEPKDQGAAEPKDMDGEEREEEAAPAAGERGEQGGAGAPGAGAAAPPPAPTLPAAAQPPVRDGERVLVCLKRALKTAHAAQQQLAAALKGADTAPAALFVEILNHYLFYFGQGMPGITPSVLQARCSSGIACPPAARTSKPHARSVICHAPPSSAPLPGFTVAWAAAPRRQRDALDAALGAPAARGRAIRRSRSPGAGTRPAARRAGRSRRHEAVGREYPDRCWPGSVRCKAASCFQRTPAGAAGPAGSGREGLG